MTSSRVNPLGVCLLLSRSYIAGVRTLAIWLLCLLRSGYSCSEEYFIFVWLCVLPKGMADPWSEDGRERRWKKNPNKPQNTDRVRTESTADMHIQMGVSLGGGLADKRFIPLCSAFSRWQHMHHISFVKHNWSYFFFFFLITLKNYSNVNISSCSKKRL